MKYHQGCCLEKMTFYFWTKMLMDSSLNLQNVDLSKAEQINQCQECQ